MKLKKYLETRNIKHCEIAKEIRVDPARLSKHLNGWLPLPHKHQIQLAEFLGISQKEIAEDNLKIASKRMGSTLV